MKTNDARLAHEIKSRTDMAIGTFTKKKTHFTNKLDLNLRKKLVNCYFWSIVWYGHKIGYLEL